MNNMIGKKTIWTLSMAVCVLVAIAVVRANEVKTDPVFSLDHSPITRAEGANALSYSSVVKKVRPSIVSISTSKTVQVSNNIFEFGDGMSPFGDGIFRRFDDRILKNVSGGANVISDILVAAVGALMNGKTVCGTGSRYLFDLVIVTNRFHNVIDVVMTTSFAGVKRIAVFLAGHFVFFNNVFVTEGQHDVIRIVVSAIHTKMGSVPSVSTSRLNNDQRIVVFL